MPRSRPSRRSLRSAESGEMRTLDGRPYRWGGRKLRAEISRHGCVLEWLRIAGHQMSSCCNTPCNECGAGTSCKRSVKSACREASVRAMIAACEQQQRKCPLAA